MVKMVMSEFEQAELVDTWPCGSKKILGYFHQHLNLYNDFICCDYGMHGSVVIMFTAFVSLMFISVLSPELVTFTFTNVCFKTLW